MEINPNHALIIKLNQLINTNNVEAKSLALKIIQISTIASGFDLENPSEFASGMFKIMLQNAGIEEKDAVTSVELPEETVEENPVEKEANNTSGAEKGFDDEEDEQVEKEKRDEL